MFQLLELLQCLWQAVLLCVFTYFLPQKVLRMVALCILLVAYWKPNRSCLIQILVAALKDKPCLAVMRFTSVTS